MTEIIKDRIGKPLFQHTTFLKDKKPLQGKESQDQDEPSLNVYRYGIFVKLSTLDIFDRQEILYQEHVPGSVDLQSKRQYVQIYIGSKPKERIGKSSHPRVQPTENEADRI